MVFVDTGYRLSDNAYRSEAEIVLERPDMNSDDLTKELPDSEPEENKGRISDEMHRMFSPIYDLQRSIQDLASQFSAFANRLDAMEQKLEQRQLETKPIWEKALQEIAETRVEMREEFTKVHAELRDVNQRVRTLALSVFDLQNTQRVIDERVTDLERKAS